MLFKEITQASPTTLKYNIYAVVSLLVVQVPVFTGYQFRKCSGKTDFDISMARGADMFGKSHTLASRILRIAMNPKVFSAVNQREREFKKLSPIIRSTRICIN